MKVANPDQKNGNRPSEIVNQAVALGDACEPVPVPLMKTASYTAAAAKLSGKALDLTPITTTESFVNALTVELMPPRDSMGVAKPVTVPTTQLRYCRTNAATGIRNMCFDNTSEAIGDRYLVQDKNFNPITSRAAETLRSARASPCGWIACMNFCTRPSRFVNVPRFSACAQPGKT